MRVQWGKPIKRKSRVHLSFLEMSYAASFWVAARSVAPVVDDVNLCEIQNCHQRSCHVVGRHSEYPVGQWEPLSCRAALDHSVSCFASHQHRLRLAHVLFRAIRQECRAVNFLRQPRWLALLQAFPDTRRLSGELREQIGAWFLREWQSRSAHRHQSPPEWHLPGRLCRFRKRQRCSISHEIIAKQGGRLWLESESGHGSAFSFALPLEETAS
jgi:hypothetical protein